MTYDERMIYDEHMTCVARMYYGEQKYYHRTLIIDKFIKYSRKNKKNLYKLAFILEKIFI